jgi:O-antigen ligase
MKKHEKQRTSAHRAESRRPGILEIVLIGLPFIALIPNVFVPPALSIKGLATQELALALYSLLVIAVAGWEIWRRGEKGFTLERETILLLLTLTVFLGWQALSLGWSPAGGEGARLVWIWLIFGFFVSLILLRLTAGAVQLILATLNVVSLILSLTIVYEWYEYGMNNMLGVFFNRGITAEILATLVPLHVCCFLKSRRPVVATVHFLLMAMAIAAILLSLRRGSFVALSISLLLLILAWVFRRVDLGHPRRAIVLGLILLVGVVSVGVTNRQVVIDRLKGAVTLSGGEDGLISRVRGWYTAVEIVKAHPLIGIGKGGYASLYGDYRAAWVNRPENRTVSEAAGPEDDDLIGSPLVHNELLENQVELGVVGSILLLLLIALLIRRLWSAMRSTEGHIAAGALFGLIAFAISSMTSGFSFRYTPEVIALAALLGIGLTLGATKEEGADHRVALPRFVPAAVVVVLLILFAAMAWRNERVFQSQQLQGRKALDTPELDFAYYARNENGNESLVRRYRQVLEYDPQNSGAHLGYALLLYQLKRNQEALPHAEYARRHGYGRPFGYVLEAFIHEQLGDLNQSTRILESAAAAYPQSFFVRATLVEFLRRGNRLEEMRKHQTVMYERDQKTMQSWEVYLRSHPETAVSEATAKGLHPMTFFTNRLAISLVAMRGFHYLGR